MESGEGLEPLQAHGVLCEHFGLNGVTELLSRGASPYDVDDSA
jgi:hypothetical protein